MRFQLVATQEEMVKSCSRKGFEMVEEKRTSDFRRRTSADVSGGRCMRRPGRRLVAEPMESKGHAAAAGSPAFDVRIPLSAAARGLSPAGLSLTQRRRGAELCVKERAGTVPAES